MSEDLGVAVAQFASGSDKAANLREIRDFATVAAQRGAKLVVFPEYSCHFLPSLCEDSVAAAERLDGPFVAALSALATVLDVHIVAGLLEALPGEAAPVDAPQRHGIQNNRAFNTIVAIAPTLGLVAKYRKIHLYDAFGQSESEWVAAGAVDAPELFHLDGFSVGLQTCYDIRFPEITRRLADAGADLVLVPAAWVLGPLKEQHWRTLVTARAIENTLYLATADQAVPAGIGLSMIVDPRGVELAALGEQPGQAIAWISPGVVEKTRAANPALALRRFAVVPR